MSNLPALTREQSRRVDQLAIEKYGLSGRVLMENAGRGAVDVLLRVDPELATSGHVAILCGKGNNAGDGFVMARHLAIRGVDATTVLLSDPTELSGDALANYETLAATSAAIADVSGEAADESSVQAALERCASGARWYVDAMLGTGARGEPRHPYAAAIAWMNAQPGQRLAIDIPSGLDCDSGAAAAHTVRADVTCTFVAPKAGMLTPAAKSWIGQLRVASIGTPARLVEDVLAQRK